MLHTFFHYGNQSKSYSLNQSNHSNKSSTLFSPLLSLTLFTAPRVSSLTQDYSKKLTIENNTRLRVSRTRLIQDITLSPNSELTALYMKGCQVTSFSQELDSNTSFSSSLTLIQIRDTNQVHTFFNLDGCDWFGDKIYRIVISMNFLYHNYKNHKNLRLKW